MRHGWENTTPLVSLGYGMATALPENGELGVIKEHGHKGYQRKHEPEVN